MNYSVNSKLAAMQRIEPASCWKDLVLPESQRDILRQIVVHASGGIEAVARPVSINKDVQSLPLGILFVGGSHRGKIVAAEVLAKQLGKQLYFTNLSSVISKWIGETEEYLRKLFDVAGNDAILMFDEADSLFGKRGQINDGHDRYTNVNTSYLLKCIEEYQGLVILASNSKTALDDAFTRRFRYVVEFPSPDAEGRQSIWRRCFPK